MCWGKEGGEGTIEGRGGRVWVRFEGWGWGGGIRGSGVEGGGCKILCKGGR